MKRILVTAGVLCGLSLPVSSLASLPVGYEALTYGQKYTHLLKSIRESAVTRDLSPVGTSEFMALLKPSFLAQTFTHTSDELPIGRKKILHTYGATAGVIFESVPGHEYSGLFDTGAYGLLRLSVAHIDGSDISPGLALKLLVSKRPSVNIHAMVGWGGQGQNLNLFAHAMKTQVPVSNDLGFLQRQVLETFEITVRALHSLGTGPANFSTMPLNEMASVYSDGTFEDPRTISYPDRLEFVPSDSAKNAMRQSGASVASALPDFRAPLRDRLRVGMVLYTVNAIKDSGVQAGVRVPVGHIVMLTPFHATEYQDKHLFFKHASAF